MSMLVTMPGTLTNVTPEIEAPIIPKATIYQGDLLFARKNVSFVARLPVSRLMPNKTAK